MTWDEKIESLIALAKAAGRYVNAENGTDYCVEAYEKLKETYEEFCQWRHDEPYVVDEIHALMQQVKETVAGALNISPENGAPTKIMNHVVCAQCGKFYEGMLSVGWYGQRINGQEWVFCSEQHLRSWKLDQEVKKGASKHNDTGA